MEDGAQPNAQHDSVAIAAYTQCNRPSEAEVSLYNKSMLVNIYSIGMRIQ